MRAIELETTINEHGELHVRLPAEVRAGPARVIVLYDERESTVAPANGELLAFLKDLNQGNWPARSQADIDSQIQRERDSWV
jgi:virulence-associated protein VagC